MKYSSLFYLLMFFIAISACKKYDQKVSIIPVPFTVTEHKGSFKINSHTMFFCNLSEEQSSGLLKFILEDIPDLKATEDKPLSNFIQLILSDDLKDYSDEGYSLIVDQHGIIISSSGCAGLFYGLQSLFQLIQINGRDLPYVEIKDKPRFGYRGFHLDVSRHFFDKEFVKRQMDLMAYYKLNHFHWHLTDGAGWRIEIEKYPLLTEIAAWRPQKTWFEWSQNGQAYGKNSNGVAYGGFYTKEDVREIVAYAKERFITIIPEIEMPGHSEEVLAAYPNLSCSGKPYVDSDFCIGNDETFTFLEDVLTEVMELFPSEYIHIGGDEATKKGWACCSKCQARMAKNGLANLDELQNYLVLHIEQFLNRNGRKLIGWDEILDGGLSKSATVMAWRGVESGIKSAKQGNFTIMTPDAYCYFDHYQDAPPTQPVAMPALLTLEKVYSFDPVPPDLTVGEQSLILGVQAKLWTESIPSCEHAEYMIYPRFFALAEVAWSQPSRKYYPDFRNRALAAVGHIKSKGFNPFDLKNEIGKRPESLKSISHLALGKPVVYKTSYHPKYAAAGDLTLTDGLAGDWSYMDGRWQGFLNSDMDVVIDMGVVKPITSVSAQFMQQSGADIWFPSRFEIFTSIDGVDYRNIKELYTDVSVDDPRVIYSNFGWNGKTDARFIRFVARKTGIEGGWIFTDEIMVE